MDENTSTGARPVDSISVSIKIFQSKNSYGSCFRCLSLGVSQKLDIHVVWMLQTAPIQSLKSSQNPRPKSDRSIAACRQ